MSRIWNPLAFDIFGNPNPIVAPPQLRVLGGALTEVQALSAQNVFAKFCGSARLSSVPNPTEYGQLPDGSQYKIVDVAGNRTMLVWPTTTERNGLPSGVGLYATHVGEELHRVYILTWVDGAWRKKSVLEAYGAQGLWASSQGGAYLTDGVNEQFPPITLIPRKLSRTPSNQLTALATATSTNLGMAYGNTNGGYPIVTAAGRYAQVKVEQPGNYNEFKVLVSDTNVVPNSEIEKTPDVVAVSPTPVAELSAIYTPPPSATDRQLLYPNLTGKSAATRLRDGSAVLFPVTPVYPLMLESVGANRVFPPHAITTVLRVNLEPDGSYTHQFDEIGVVAVTEATPTGDPAAGNTLWQISQSRDSYKSGGDVRMVSGTFPARTGSVAVVGGLLGYAEHITDDKHLQRRRVTRAPCYVSGNWDDANVIISAVRTDDEDVRYTSVGDYKYNRPFCRQLDGHWHAYMYGLGFSLPEIHEEIQPWETLNSLPNLDEAPPNELRGESLVLLDNSDRTVVYTSKSNTKLETPWGDIIAATNNVSITTKYTLRLGAENVPNYTDFKVIGATGTSRYSKFLLVEPSLGIVAFIDITTGGFSTHNDATARTFGSKAEIVVLHRGVEIYRAPGPAVQEAVVTLAPNDTHVIMSIVPPNSTAGSATDFTQVTGYICVYWSEDNEVRTRLITGPAIYRHVFFAIDAPDQPIELNNFAIKVPVPRPTVEFDNGGFVVKAAIDPGSGNGVVTVTLGDTTLDGWAITRGGKRERLLDILSAGAPPVETIHGALVSV